MKNLFNKFDRASKMHGMDHVSASACKDGRTFNVNTGLAHRGNLGIPFING